MKKSSVLSVLVAAVLLVGCGEEKTVVEQSAPVANPDKNPPKKLMKFSIPEKKDPSAYADKF